MSNLAMSTDVVNPDESKEKTLNDFFAWAEVRAKGKSYNPATLANAVRAVRMIEQVLEDHEPRTLSYFLERLNELVARLGNGGGAEAKSLKTYRSRARTIVGDFLAFCDDPLSFEPSSRRGKGRPSPERKKPPQRATTRRLAGPGLNTFHLNPSGQKILYAIPASLSVADVERFTYHLLTHAHDWSPNKTVGVLGTGND